MMGKNQLGKRIADRKIKSGVGAKYVWADRMTTFPNGSFISFEEMPGSRWAGVTFGRFYLDHFELPPEEKPAGE